MFVRFNTALPSLVPMERRIHSSSRSQLPCEKFRKLVLMKAYFQVWKNSSVSHVAPNMRNHFITKNFFFRCCSSQFGLVHWEICICLSMKFFDSYLLEFVGIPTCLSCWTRGDPLVLYFCYASVCVINNCQNKACISFEWKSRIIVLYPYTPRELFCPDNQYLVEIKELFY